MLGTIVKIGNPEVIIYGIIVFSMYSFVRYLQYYWEEGHVKDGHKELKDNLVKIEADHIRSQIWALLGDNLVNDVELQFCNPSYTSFNHASVDSYRELSLGPGFNVQIPIAVKSRFEEKRRSDEDEASYQSFSAFFSKLPSWEKFEHKRYENQYVRFRSSYSVSLGYYLWNRIAAVSKYVFRTSLFTDYELPLLVSFLSALSVAFYAI